LVRDISELIHALQKERGTSSIFLGSNGAQFADRLGARVAHCRDLEQVVRERLERVDEKLDRMSCGARFYTRVALAFRALDSLAGIREQIVALTMAPQDAIKEFTEIIGCLLGVGFEVADIAADPAISRALVALVNYVQGKEYAGQERATAGAVFSRGSFHAVDQRRLRQLVTAQVQAFRIFAAFSDPAHLAAFNQVIAGRDSAEVRRMREIVFAGSPPGQAVGVTADGWFEHATRRIDAMKSIEDQMAAALGHLCGAKLAEVSGEPDPADTGHLHAITTTAPAAMLVMGVEPAPDQLGSEGGVGLYTFDGSYTLDCSAPRPMRSIFEVIQAQSRRIDQMSNQLESARVALAERKVIERAKGLLMNSRKLSEKEAYALMRETAMNQNKRISEVAEALVSMAELLKA
jgi:hypothetical protein